MELLFWKNFFFKYSDFVFVFSNDNKDKVMEVEIEIRGINWGKEEEKVGGDRIRKGSWIELKGLKSRKFGIREEGVRGREDVFSVDGFFRGLRVILDIDFWFWRKRY